VTRSVRIGLASVAVVVAGGLMFLSIDRILERQRTEDQINSLRDDIYRSRVASDRCRGSLQTSQAALLELSVAIDSLRRVVDDYQYNDSVGVWEGREERLRTAETACRTTIEAHNVLTDSLQSVLVAAGIITE
jgi:alkylation response protein AidB-like acyl-CoA dehydrogenase